MLRSRFALLALVPALVIGSAACAGGDTGDPGAEELGSGALAVNVLGESPLSGTFRDETAPGGIAVLTLKTDSTFHMEEAVVCVRAPCINPSVDGHYTVGEQHGMNVLTFIDEAGNTIDVLRYALRADTLYLAETGAKSPWQALKRSEASWCGGPSDCSLQGLSEPQCAAGWVCATNVCVSACEPMDCTSGKCPE